MPEQSGGKGHANSLRDCVGRVRSETIKAGQTCRLALLRRATRSVQSQERPDTTLFFCETAQRLPPEWREDAESALASALAGWQHGRRLL